MTSPLGLWQCILVKAEFEMVVALPMSNLMRSVIRDVVFRPSFDLLLKDWNANYILEINRIREQYLQQRAGESLLFVSLLFLSLLMKILIIIKMGLKLITSYIIMHQGAHQFYFLVSLPICYYHIRNSSRGPVTKIEFSSLVGPLMDLLVATTSMTYGPYSHLNFCKTNVTLG